VIVVDASARVELLIGTDVGAQVGHRLRSMDLHAPAHVDVEVVGALRRAVLGEWLTRHEAASAVVEFGQLRMRRWPLTGLSMAAFDYLETITVADAYYVVLAEALDVPLITCDGRLARSHGHHATVELIAAN
jgi:predicted nucleic acid-binding protein